MGGFDIGPSRTKWLVTDRHIVIYYTTKAKSEVYFVTRMPEPAEWLTRESWSAKGDVEELRAAYEGFYQDVCNVLEACSDCHKWAILEREPLPRWSDGRVVLLGDAAHPMTPYMAQGAATSIEDAAILARCLDAVKGEDIEGPSNVTRLTANGAHRLCRRSPARTPGCGTSAAATRAGFMATMPGARTSISLLRTRKCRQHDQRRTGGNVEAFVGDGMRLTRCNNYHDFRGLARRRLPGGIMSVEDAKKAVDIGCAGIVVSNYGGRQLDGSRSSFDQLAEIVDAVGGKIDVLFDGAVHRGTHVLKALSLGARAVGGGRYYLFALGAAGVERALQLMRVEIERDMRLMGCASISQLSRRNLRFRNG
jgi:hypothetical protein